MKPDDMSLLRPIDLVELVKKASPRLLGNLPEQKAAALIQAAFLQIGRHIDAMEDGAVSVPGFGSFRIRQIEREKDGQQVTVKRIIFRAVKKRSSDTQQVTE